MSGALSCDYAIRRTCVALAIALGGCGLDNEVGQGGEYGVIGSRVTDTAPLPLRHLLMVEEDAVSGRTLVYLFSGELGAAALGLRDLRRVASGFGRFTISFDAERQGYVRESPRSRGGSVELELDDGREIELSRLDTDGLYTTGASRFLRTLDSSDFAVSAHFGFFEEQESRPEGELDVSGTRLRFAPRLSRPRLEVVDEDEALVIEYGELPEADYLAFEPFQVITEIEAGEDSDAGIGDDGDAGVDEDAEPRRLEALTRTELAPGSAYALGAALLSDAYAQGCWSKDKPLLVRIDQVARDYHRGRDGDWALIQHKLDVITIDPERWTPLIDESLPKPAYCDGFR